VGRKQGQQKLFEITKVLSLTKSIDLMLGDRNEYSFEVETPSIDELSFMPKFLTPDEE